MNKSPYRVFIRDKGFLEVLDTRLDLDFREYLDIVDLPWDNPIFMARFTWRENCPYEDSLILVSTSKYGIIASDLTRGDYRPPGEEIVSPPIQNILMFMNPKNIPQKYIVPIEEYLDAQIPRYIR